MTPVTRPTRGHTRRDALRLALFGAGAAALAGCGAPAARSAAPPATAPSSFWEGRTGSGRFTFANFAQYIDVDPDDPALRPSLELFTEETDIEVDYREVITDSATWFGRVGPQLQAGRSTGFDLMVNGTDVYLARLIDQGLLAPLDPARLPTFAEQAGAAFRDPPGDPGNRYTVPWQAGMTGIVYDPARVGREITSWEDLRDPALAGKVQMWSDIVQLPNVALLAVGVDPVASTEDDWVAARDWLVAQRESGVVRSYDQSTYLLALESGDVWASLGYSGDAHQLNLAGSSLEFVIPDEGGLLWTDNLCIPVTAENPVDALAYLDFVYRPEIAAMITEYVGFVTPVPAARDVLRRRAGEASGETAAALQAVADSPLVFPDEDTLSRLSAFRPLDDAEQERWNDLFLPVYQ
jgi:spermidine/putrescine transport system substrate-binding protein